MIEKWTAVVVGAWVLLSPWLLGFANISLAKWSNIACGLVLVIVNIWLIFGEKPMKSSGTEK